MAPFLTGLGNVKCMQDVSNWSLLMVTVMYNFTYIRSAHHSLNHLNIVQLIQEQAQICPSSIITLILHGNKGQNLRNEWWAEIENKP